MASSLRSTQAGDLFCRHFATDYLGTLQYRNWSVNEYLSEVTYLQAVDIAHSAITEVLHGPSCYRPTDQTEQYIDFSDALSQRLVELEQRKPLGSPQIHHGYIDVLREPTIDYSSNRNGSSLPRGAFWTSDVLDDSGIDSWAIYQADVLDGNRYELDFAPDTVSVATIDSAAAWSRLVQQYPQVEVGATYPDWPVIAADYDAVRLTVTGLLLAHPPLLDTPVASVAEWSTVSTAWLRLPLRYSIARTSPELPTHDSR